MNDATLKELKIAVERTVRPVRATIARKRLIREELLTHLMGIFDEEFTRLADARAALDCARQRFGDPVALSSELRNSVPLWNWCLSFLENLGYRENESAWHLAAKHFLALLLFWLWLPVWFLVALRGRPLEDCQLPPLSTAALMAGMVVVAALFDVIPSIILAILLRKMGTAPVSRLRGRVLLVLLAVLCGFLLLCGLAVPLFWGVAVLFALMGRQAVKEWRFRREWA